jgi:hypothetical protein
MQIINCGPKLGTPRRIKAVARLAPSLPGMAQSELRVSYDAQDRRSWIADPLNSIGCLYQGPDFSDVARHRARKVDSHYFTIIQPNEP